MVAFGAISRNQEVELASLVRKHGVGGMSGLRLVYSSATAVLLEAGSCRDSADAYDLTLAAQVTLTATNQGALGLDEVTLAATATTNGTTAVTLSASLWSETAMAAVVRSLTGTITSSGTTVTGSGTEFLKYAPGDVIRSASNGASRITAVASDTSLTIAAAFPGGDIGAGQAATLYENLTLWPDTASSADKRRVNTVSHAGTAVVLSSSVASSGSGKTARIGVEVASCWFFPWVRYGSTGTTGQLSTQRTRPYPLSGYDTAWRRVPAATYNNASGDIDEALDRFGGAVRYIAWADSNDKHPILSAGSATSWTRVASDIGAPPTAATIALTLIVFEATFASTPAYLVLQVRHLRADGTSQVVASAGVHCGTSSSTAGTIYASGALVTHDGGLEYQLTRGVIEAVGGNPAYIFALGWWEVS